MLETPVCQLHHLSLIFNCQKSYFAKVTPANIGAA